MKIDAIDNDFSLTDDQCIYINNDIFIQFRELDAVFFILNVATVSFSHYNGT